MQLPKFSGSVLDWQGFYDGFCAAVHSNQSLSNVQKMTHLRACLLGKAYRCIEGYAVINTNYEKALQDLKDRFGRKRIVINELVKSILNLEVPDKADSRTLRYLYDTLKNRMRSLESYGMKPDDNESLTMVFLPIFEMKLPGELREKWELELTKNNLLSKYQSGFRRLHSTPTALLDATTEWFLNMDMGKLNSVVFLDLSKAFDTVDHSILLKKLSLYGISQESLIWFTYSSYLSNRKQQCFVNGHLSVPRTITCGVPQGSILGPLLFLIYINDLPYCLEYSNPRMYDATLTTTGQSLNELIYATNSDLSNISQWLLANKLSLNVAKTEHMFIASNDKLNKLRDMPYAFINNQPIKRVRSSI